MRSAIFVTSAILACAGVPHIAAGQAMKKPEGPTRYLKSSDFPDPRSYLPTPPVPGTPAFAADRAAYTAALAGKDGAAWQVEVAVPHLAHAGLAQGTPLRPTESPPATDAVLEEILAAQRLWHANEGAEQRQVQQPGPIG